MDHLHHALGAGICDKMIHKSSCLQHLKKKKNWIHELHCFSYYNVNSGQLLLDYDCPPQSRVLKGCKWVEVCKPIIIP